MNKAMLRVSVAKFAGEVDRLREEADRLHESGWRWSVPAHRGEMYGLVAETLRGEFIRATKLEGEKGDLRNYSRRGAHGPPSRCRRPHRNGRALHGLRQQGYGGSGFHPRACLERGHGSHAPQDGRLARG
jgi:hypothetical protein